MFLAPQITAKAVGKIQPSETITKAVSGYLRRDALNAVKKAEEVVSAPNKYFSPCTPIDTAAIAPKDCANVIDFRF